MSVNCEPENRSLSGIQSLAFRWRCCILPRRGRRAGLSSNVSRVDPDQGDVLTFHSRSAGGRTSANSEPRRPFGNVAVAEAETSPIRVESQCLLWVESGHSGRS